MSVLMMFLSWLSFRKWNSSLGSLHVKSVVNLKVISFLTSSMLRISLNSTVILTFVRPSSSTNLGNLFKNNGEGGWKYQIFTIIHSILQLSHRTSLLYPLVGYWTKLQLSSSDWSTQSMELSQRLSEGTHCPLSGGQSRV